MASREMEQSPLTMKEKIGASHPQIQQQVMSVLAAGLEKPIEKAQQGRELSWTERKWICHVPVKFVKNKAALREGK